MMSFLVFALLLGADPALPSGHPPLTATGAGALGGLPQAPVVVSVRALSPSGRELPAVGAEVRLELTRMSEMGETALERVWVASADGLGQASFGDVPELGPGRRLTAIARWHGVEWRRAVADRLQPTSLVAYAVTGDRSSLRARMSYTVIPGEEELIIDQLMHVTTGDDPRAVDLERGDGLPIPLLVHAVFGQPVPGGWVPPRVSPETTRIELQPPADELGRLVVERGTLVYRGVVPPGGVVVSAQYPVSYVDDTDHLLAFTAPIEVETLQFTMPVASGLAPEIAPRVPFHTVSRPTADGVQRLIVPLVMPKAGEPVLLDVRDTPSRLALLRPLTVSLSVLVVVVLWLVFLRTRRRAPVTVEGESP
ncbi:MAG: hypothetical protein IT385_18195 [Deltaproteobacteria bacterium]|nr:hypothetical protein [Deltaproteobacteria bacterium]